MSFFQQHAESILAVAAALGPVLLPPVNRWLAKITGNQYVRKGLEVAKALEDGIELNEVKSLLD